MMARLVRRQLSKMLARGAGIVTAERSDWFFLTNPNPSRGLARYQIASAVGA
jgi:hypothetical protein